MNKLISSIWEINGEIVTINGEEPSIGSPPVAPNPVTYAADGWSVMTSHGCVRNKEVDDYLAAMALGDRYQQEQAKIAVRWFAVFVEGRNYDDATRKLLIRNYQQDNNSPTMISGMLGKMMMEQFYPDVKRDMTDTKPPFSYIYGDALEGHQTPIFGFNMYKVGKLFAKKHIQSLVEGIESMKHKEKYPNSFGTK